MGLAEHGNLQLGPTPKTERNKVEINISIRHIGHATGTIGWLAEHAHHITIAPSKEGNQCAWLYNKDGKLLTLLACREYDTVERVAKASMGAPWSTETSFTDAAWEIVQSLADIAIAAMEENSELAAGYKVAVAV